MGSGDVGEGGRAVEKAELERAFVAAMVEVGLCSSLVVSRPPLHSSETRISSFTKASSLTSTTLTFETARGLPLGLGRSMTDPTTIGAAWSLSAVVIVAFTTVSNEMVAVSELGLSGTSRFEGQASREILRKWDGRIGSSKKLEEERESRGGEMGRRAEGGAVRGR